MNLTTIKRHTLSQSEVDQFIKENGLQKLDDGERESLYLCKQLGIPLILTDDLAVRDAAKILNIIPVGSLGVVVKAYGTGQISLIDAERSITALYDISSLFVTRAIVEIAIDQLHKDFPHE